MHSPDPAAGPAVAGARPGRVLLRPRVARVLVLYVLARVPAAAVWLSVVLSVSTTSGSYGRAGLAVGAYGLGVAAFAPVLGTLADRYGARTVLLASAGLQLPALLLLAASGRGAAALLLSSAFVAGAVQPPLVPCMRAGWALLVDDSELETCYAFDSVLGEAVDLAAPLLAVALDVLGDGGGSLPVVALAVAATTGVFACAVPYRTRPAGSAPWRLDAVRPARPVLVVVLLLTAALGAVEVASIALADGLGSRSSAGLLLGAFTAGSVLGGVLHARRGPTTAPARQLLLLLALLGAGLSGVALAPAVLAVLALLLLVAGTAVAPLVTVLLSCLQRSAPPGRETETFTWGTTANYVGVSAGSAAAGAVGDGLAGSAPGGLPAVLLAVALVAATAAAVAVLGRRLPQPVADAVQGAADAARGAELPAPRSDAPAVPAAPR